MIRPGKKPRIKISTKLTCAGKVVGSIKAGLASLKSTCSIGSSLLLAGAAVSCAAKKKNVIT